MPWIVSIISVIILMAFTVEIHTAQLISRITALIAIFAGIDSFGCQMMDGRASGGRRGRCAIKRTLGLIEELAAVLAFYGLVLDFLGTIGALFHDGRWSGVSSGLTRAFLNHVPSMARKSAVGMKPRKSEGGVHRLRLPFVPRCSLSAAGERTALRLREHHARFHVAGYYGIA
jgi:hypothetical protein